MHQTQFATRPQCQITNFVLNNTRWAAAVIFWTARRTGDANRIIYKANSAPARETNSDATALQEPYGRWIAWCYQDHQRKSDHQAFREGVDALNQANDEAQIRLMESRVKDSRNCSSIPRISEGICLTWRERRGRRGLAFASSVTLGWSPPPAPLSPPPMRERWRRVRACWHPNVADVINGCKWKEIRDPTQ